MPHIFREFEKCACVFLAPLRLHMRTLNQSSTHLVHVGYYVRRNTACATVQSLMHDNFLARAGFFEHRFLRLHRAKPHEVIKLNSITYLRWNFRTQFLSKHRDIISQQNYSADHRLCKTAFYYRKMRRFVLACKSIAFRINNNVGVFFRRAVVSFFCSPWCKLQLI